MKRFLLCIAVLLSTVAALGCTEYQRSEKTSASGEEEALLFGVVLHSRTQEWAVDVEASMKRAAHEAGVQLLFTDSGGSKAKIIQAVEDLIESGVDAVIATAPDTEMVRCITDIADNAGVPLFFYDSYVADDRGITAYTASNLEDDGAAMAAWTAAYIEKNLGGKANVCILDDFASEASKQRANSFAQTLAKSTRMVKILSRIDAGTDRVQSMYLMENILTGSNNDIDVAVCMNYESGAGASAAIKNAGAKSVIVSVGWGQEACETLEQQDGAMVALLMCRPSYMAKIVTAAKDAFDGKLEDKRIESLYVMVDQESIFTLNWREEKDALEQAGD